MSKMNQIIRLSISIVLSINVRYLYLNYNKPIFRLLNPLILTILPSFLKNIFFKMFIIIIIIYFTPPNFNPSMHAFIRF
jgi:hypothetical protein